MQIDINKLKVLYLSSYPMFILVHSTEYSFYKCLLINHLAHKPASYPGANNVLKIATLQCFYIDQWLRWVIFRTLFAPGYEAAHKLSLLNANRIFFLKGLITSTDGKIPTKTDLEGFWDLVMLQVWNYSLVLYSIPN
jgi:hypothetical protein